MQFSRDLLYVGGQWMKSSTDETIEIISPATDQVIGKVVSAGPFDVDVAVTAARQALHGEWRGLSIHQRMEVIHRAADHLAEHAREIVELLACEMGAPVGGEGLRSPLERMRNSFYAAAIQVPMDEIRRSEQGTALLKQLPVGVVAAITPWNTAFGGVILKTIPALLAGCPVVLKPSPQTALDPFYLAEAFEAAGLPAGLFSVLPGGADVGEALVRHPGIDMVTFTGSSQVGRMIASMATESMKRVVLECGGKSAALIMEDADFDQTVATVAGANYSLSGQYCRALSRVLVPRARYEEFVDGFTDYAQKIVVGDPLDPRTQFGPLSSRAQWERTARYVALGIEEGARLVTGGSRPDGLPVGQYFAPTVFADVHNTMRIAQEEIFGPVLSLIAYDSVDEAIKIANDSTYGLSGAIFTTDFEAGLDVASSIDTGLIGINAQGARESVPCGGVKLSGMGDEHGPEGFREFLQPKSIIIPATLADRLERDGVPSTTVTVTAPNEG